MKELPKYYVIKRDPSNPLWEKFSKWAKKKYNIEWAFVLYNYYGYDGHSTAFGFACQDNINNFQNSPTLITLEQWDEAVNPFVLPEKWCVKVTRENLDELGGYFNKQSSHHCYSSYNWVGRYYHSHNNNDELITNKGFWGASFADPKRENYTEITFAQFKKHVLKENNMSKEDLLEEAKRRYPIGTEFLNAFGKHEAQTIRGNNIEFYDSEPSKISIHESSSHGLIYHDGLWAEIISKTAPKDRTITAQQAQSIIDVACCGWAPRLAEMWGKNICIKNPITITESFYKEMRSKCTPEQHTLFDSIFGKDKKEVCITSLKTGEWLRTENGNTYLKVGDKVFCKDNDKLHDMHTITGKKVRIKNIEFEEVND